MNIEELLRILKCGEYISSEVMSAVNKVLLERLEEESKR